MSAVYIITDFGSLHKSDETLVFSQPDGGKTILFPYKTEQLVLMGNINISGEALRLITKYKIPVSLLSKNGRFNGKISFGENKNVFLRQRQYGILAKEKKSLEIAKSIVVGKIKNQISFMQRIKRKSESDDSTIDNAINKTKEVLKRAEDAQNIESLRGFEGNAAKLYFSVFGKNINPSWAVFEKRSKNPPKSNVNAVLSFLYTLLSYRVESALEGLGLDICCGNLHSLNYGKSALVYDLMEEFRAPIADTVCCSLFNLGQLKDDDFESVSLNSDSDDVPVDSDTIPDDSTEKNINSFDTGIFLTKTGLKKVISAFEEKIDSWILYAPTNSKISYKNIIYEQAAHYKRVVMEEEKEYKPYYFK